MSGHTIISTSELEEICTCYQCDCETKSCGICTWEGEPCLECFNIRTYEHLEPDSERPSLFKRPTQDVGSAPDFPRLTNTITEYTSLGNGDCLYDCVSKALSTNGTRLISIASLRSLVARYQTSETFAAYRAVANQSGYDCIKKARTLRALKNVIQVSGGDVGPEKCLWGDENTLNIVSKTYNVRFAIFNGEGALVQVIETERSHVYTILLKLYQTEEVEHYNLLLFGMKSLLHARDWELLQHLLSKTRSAQFAG